MHSTIHTNEIATSELYSDLEQQRHEIASAPIKLKTPQRKAKYHDKQRFRLKQLKEAALLKLHCTSEQIKNRLLSIGVKLDLRLTSSWYAIVFELMPLLKKQSNLATKTFQVGDRVIWTQCPAILSYVEKWFPLQVVSCDRDMVSLDPLCFPVSASEIEIVN